MVRGFSPSSVSSSAVILFLFNSSFRNTLVWRRKKMVEKFYFYSRGTCVRVEILSANKRMKQKNTHTQNMATQSSSLLTIFNGPCNSCNGKISPFIRKILEDWKVVSSGKNAIQRNRKEWRRNNFSVFSYISSSFSLSVCVQAWVILASQCPWQPVHSWAHMCAHKARNYSRQRFLLPVNMGERFANNIYFMIII